jgi:hypothetical protein
MDTMIIIEHGATVPQHVHDEIQKLRTKTNPPEQGRMKTQEAPLNT